MLLKFDSKVAGFGLYNFEQDGDGWLSWEWEWFVIPAMPLPLGPPFDCMVSCGPEKSGI